MAPFFGFVLEENVDVESLKMEENTPSNDENTLVAGNPVESWISTVQALEKSSDVLANQIVYSNDEEGNTVPIAIIIDGGFAENQNNLDFPFAHQSDLLMNQECNWVACQEECVTNETEKENEKLVKYEGENQDVENETIKVRDEEVIKVYKIGVGKKHTLKNLKKNQKMKKISKNMWQKGQVAVGKKKTVHNIQKAVKKTRKRKRISDWAYHAPTSAQKNVLRGKRNEVRKKCKPVKFEDYWDMNIPTEFYEEEFLDFENYMHFTGNMIECTKESPHANSEYHLEMYKKYQKFVQKGNKKLFRKMLNRKGSRKDDKSKGLQQRRANKNVSKNKNKLDSNSKSVSSNLVSPEWNELASLKFAIRRALSTLSIGYRGNYRNVRIFSVDLPLSPKAFCSLFAPEYGAESSFKKTFTVAEMKCVFGHDWDCFQFKNSSTRKRVFRNVYLHFRKKTIQGKSSTNLIRIQEEHNISGNMQDCDEITSHWLRVKFQAVKENCLLQTELCQKQ